MNINWNFDDGSLDGRTDRQLPFDPAEFGGMGRLAAIDAIENKVQRAFRKRVRASVRQEANCYCTNLDSLLGAIERHTSGLEVAHG